MARWRPRRRSWSESASPLVEGRPRAAKGERERSCFLGHFVVMVTAHLPSRRRRLDFSRYVQAPGAPQRRRARRQCRAAPVTRAGQKRTPLTPR